jgi:lysophospholipase L1-like esterase
MCDAAAHDLFQLGFRKKVCFQVCKRGCSVGRTLFVCLFTALAIIIGKATVSVAAPLVVMPLGDSITDGNNYFGDALGGYRTELWRDFGSSSSRLVFVGSQQSGPFTLGDLHHEGHSGYTIADAPIVGRLGLTEHLDGSKYAYPDGNWLGPTVNPDVILLMIGTNDINLNYSVAQAPARLAALISKIATLKPAAKLIVASIPPIDDANNYFASDGNSNARAIAYNAAIPGVVAAQRALGEQVFFFDMNHMLNVSDIADGLHPTLAGYNKMGDAWFSAIQAIVPEPSTFTLLAVGGISVLACFRRRGPLPKCKS